jgi:hypothetical protein
MTWSDAAFTALIAAFVSLLASLATYVAAMRSLKHQSKMQDRELGRRFTEKLYELRLASYPKAFFITDQLRSEYVFGEILSPDFLRKVLEDLLEWNKSSAGFLLSADSLKAYYAIRKMLSAVPEHTDKYSSTQRKSIWNCKNLFRAALKRDLDLLYVEEEAPEDRNT